MELLPGFSMSMFRPRKADGPVPDSSAGSSDAVVSVTTGLHRVRSTSMPPRAKKDQQLSLEASLWEAANRLRSNMDAAEYKHVVLGLIFLKYVSDVFGVRRAELEAAVQ